MRLIFAGTPEFALVALQQLHGAGHEIALVLTQPDRHAGRGLKLRASPVKQFALAHGMAVAQPRSLRLDGKFPDDALAARGAIEAAQADAMVVAAYGLILPQWVLDAMSEAGPPQGAKAPSPSVAQGTPALGGSAVREAASVGASKLGCLNIHASLLPRWRGAAPIQRAIEAGDRESGVTIMQMDAGLDTGAMLLTERVPIATRDTGASLHDKLAQAGGRLIVQALVRASEGSLTPAPQPAQGVSYARKIDKQEALIDWRRPAAEIERQIRAFDPFPGAAAPLGAELIKLWKSEIDSELFISDNGYGTILSANPDGVRIACGTGVLRVTELQRAGGKRLAAADFLRGFALKPGMRFTP